VVLDAFLDVRQVWTRGAADERPRNRRVEAKGVQSRSRSAEQTNQQISPLFSDFICSQNLEDLQNPFLKNKV